MTTPTVPKTKRRQGEFHLPQSDSSKARLFLLTACIWPFIVLALFASSAPHVETGTNVSSPSALADKSSNLRLNVRNVLDRVDIMGYGPTHPRVAVVIVGNDKDNLKQSLASVFSTTDLNRIFVACVVVDGHAHDDAMVKELEKMDSGEVPHWHGLRPDMHKSGETAQQEDEERGRKVHVLFNKEPRGISESREDAVQFIQILSKHYEEAGLKSPQEDLILLLLQSGAQLTSRSWLAPVTEALIVPPPLLGETDTTVALKISNAVSFNLEGPGKRTSFDSTLTRVVSEPSATDIALSNGASYPTPALNGAAIAMRLETYVDLPMHDLELRGDWPANLDLAMNLWLCGDGIDMLKDLTITSLEQRLPAPLAPEKAARFAAAWMDDVTAKKFFNAYTKTYTDLTYLEWETYMSNAKASSTFRDDLAHKCRSFAWYAKEINSDLSDLLEESEIVTTTDSTEEEGKPADNQVKDADKDTVKATVKVAVNEGNKTVELPDKPLEVPNVDESMEDIISAEREGDDRKKPSTPLCKECLEIVQKAQPVDIRFVDVSGGHKEHPHMGAMDENGNLGYVHDETALRKNPPPFVFEGEEAERECAKRDNNYKMLNEKVFVDLEADKNATESGKKRDKIFCLVYTIDSAHPKIPAIRETWGSKCDGFMVGSNKTDVSIGAVNIVHEGAEEYNNIWQKVRSMWSYIYDNYYEKYDWFHIGGDDLFLIVENLRLYLESEEIKTAANGGIYLPDGTETMQTPLFLGRRFALQGDMNDIFISGGSGYTMNKAALKLLVTEEFPKFMPHAHTFSEDTMVARALREKGVYPYETKDEAGGERYMPFMPGHHYGYRMPEDHSKDWYARYSINIKEGLDHCAARSVAFHYVKGIAMKRLFALLYHKCPEPSKTE